jgi:hypothetical protein
LIALATASALQKTQARIGVGAMLLRRFWDKASGSTTFSHNCELKRALI